MQAVILAAGSGKRLHPLTANRSKAMIPVAGVPIVGRVIKEIINLGITDLIVVIKPDDDDLRSYLSDTFSEHAVIQTSIQTQPLGMGDALKQASPRIKEPFLLSACDNLFSPEDFAKFISRYRDETDLVGLLSLVAVKPEQIPHTAIVELEGDRVAAIREKPDPSSVTSRIASTPLYIFSPALISHLDGLTRSRRGEFELQDAVSSLIQSGAKVKGCLLSGRKTLTSPEDLDELTTQFLKLAEQQGRLPEHPDFPGVEIHPPVLIESDVWIDPGCVIGPYVYLESGVHVQSGTRIREGCLLRND